MKIVITGASGLIGHYFVPYIADKGHQLLLVGRDPQALKSRWPDHDCCDYAQLSARAQGYDACVHLAVRNNDASGPIEQFREANVAGLKRVWNSLHGSGFRHFINISSFHAGLTDKSDPYSVSKREADAWLAQQGQQAEDAIIVSTLLLPAVFARTMRSRLAIIERLPRPLRNLMFAMAAALKPAVDVHQVTEGIAQALDKPAPGVTIVNNSADENPFYRAFQGLCNWGVIIAVSVLLWWMLIIVAIIIRLDSDGPAIFAQSRVGKHGKPFTCYKFRTMRVGTPHMATHNVTASAVTKIGAFLRKSKLDELPQIVNIARGEMTIVGPRPCLDSQTELIAERRKLGVLEVRPGVTGWAQINDIDMSDPSRLASVDRQYIALRSILFDLSIMVKTVIGAGRQDRVSIQQK